MNTGMPLPKYHQVYLVLREQLHEGRFDAGMPGELALMAQFGVARVTVAGGREVVVFVWQQGVRGRRTGGPTLMPLWRNRRYSLHGYPACC